MNHRKHLYTKQFEKLHRKVDPNEPTPAQIKEMGYFFATPFYATHAILDHEELQGSILEPAAGEGHISKVLRDRYKGSQIVSTDLIERNDKWHCNIKSGVNFLTTKYTHRYGNIVTSPPFLLSKEFVEKALTVANRKVIMFMKLQFLEGQKRGDVLKKQPLKAVYVFLQRCAPLKDGRDFMPNGKRWSSSVPFAWFVWEKGYEGEPVIRWLD